MCVGASGRPGSLGESPVVKNVCPALCAHGASAGTVACESLGPHIAVGAAAGLLRAGTLRVDRRLLVRARTVQQPSSHREAPPENSVLGRLGSKLWLVGVVTRIRRWGGGMYYGRRTSEREFLVVKDARLLELLAELKKVQRIVISSQEGEQHSQKYLRYQCSSAL